MSSVGNREEGCRRCGRACSGPYARPHIREGSYPICLRCVRDLDEGPGNTDLDDELFDYVFGSDDE